MSPLLLLTSYKAGTKESMVRSIKGSISPFPAPVQTESRHISVSLCNYVQTPRGASSTEALLSARPRTFCTRVKDMLQAGETGKQHTADGRWPHSPPGQPAAWLTQPESELQPSLPFSMQCSQSGCVEYGHNVLISTDAPFLDPAADPAALRKADIHSRNELCGHLSRTQIRHQPGPQTFLQMSSDFSHSLPAGTRGEKATGDNMPWLSQFAGVDFCPSSRQNVGSISKHHDTGRASTRCPKNCPALLTFQYSKANRRQAMTPPQRGSGHH